MIQKGTSLLVGDNSGIKVVKCIKIFGTSNPRYAFLGDLVLVAVSNKDVIRGFSTTNIKYGLITNVVKFCKRLSGEFLRFTQNRCLVVNKNKVFPSTRIYNVIARETRSHEVVNLTLYAEAII